MEEDILDVLKNRSYFFDNGICFECQRCGSCCTGEPGVIIVNDEEITHIAQFIDISRDIFIDRCLYPFQDSYSIREVQDGRCLFFENGCSIYPVRPLQCRTFPFWFQNLRSQETWDETVKDCPGIGKGNRHSKEEILELIGLGFHLYRIALKEVMEKQ